MPLIATLATLFATLIAFSTLTAPSLADPRTSVGSYAKLAKVARELGAAPAAPETRLRAQQPTIVQRTVRGGAELRHVNVEVANVGSVSAKGIQVYIHQASGIAHALRGPKELLPRQRGTYLLNSRVVGGTGTWSVVARCSTCRR
jgi:septum formation inhibitor MinC